MKKFFKYLLYFFVASAILNGIIESFKEEPIRQDSGKEEIVEIKETERDSITQRIIAIQDSITKEITARTDSIQPTKQIDFSVVSESKVGLNSDKRGTLKVRISNSYMPTEDEIKSIAKRAFTNALKRKYNEEFTVFIYAEGMNTNQRAFAWVEFVDGKLSDNFISGYAEDYFIN